MTGASLPQARVFHSSSCPGSPSTGFGTDHAWDSSLASGILAIRSPNNYYGLCYGCSPYMLCSRSIEQTGSSRTQQHRVSPIRRQILSCCGVACQMPRPREAGFQYLFLYVREFSRTVGPGAGSQNPRRGPYKAHEARSRIS